MARETKAQQGQKSKAQLDLVGQVHLAASRVTRQQAQSVQMAVAMEESSPASKSRIPGFHRPSKEGGDDVESLSKDVAELRQGMNALQTQVGGLRESVTAMATREQVQALQASVQLISEALAAQSTRR